MAYLQLLLLTICKFPFQSLVLAGHGLVAAVEGVAFLAWLLFPVHQRLHLRQLIPQVEPWEGGRGEGEGW